MFAPALLLAAALPFLPSASAQDATITVGPGETFTFSPQQVNATVGSVITFLFSGEPGDHSVSQSSFSAPCEQLAGGFDSGFELVNSGQKAPFVSWNLTITDTNPIWFYCKQTIPSPHCLAGMVGGINLPATGNTLQSFAQSAAALKSLPAQTSGGLGASSLGALATASPATATGAEASATGGSASSAASSGASSGSASGASGSSTGSSSSTAASTSSTSGAGKSVGMSLSIVAVTVGAAVLGAYVF